MSMRCPTCGTMYADDAKFCTKDGGRLMPHGGAAAAPVTPEITGPRPTSPRANTPEIAQKILPGMQADVMISTGERTVLEYLVDPRAHLARVHELTHKTNQFTLALRRFTEAEIAERMAATTARVVAVRLSDRLSDSGIIAVLIGILLPALNKARRAAATVQCSSNMRQIATAMLQYIQVSKGRFPPSGACNNRLRRFSANTLMASASARSFRCSRTSTSIDGFNNRSYESSIAASI